MVDQPECSKNRPYLVDSIQLALKPKYLDFDKIQELFLKDKFSAAQIARQFDVSKSVILGILHRSGIRLGTKVGRSVDPKNYRNCSPPYGFKVWNNQLSTSRSEIKICRAIVQMRNSGLSTAAISGELEKRGYKNRAGRTIWNSNTILNIFKRWNGKL